MALPLNQLEALSEAHADLNQKKEDFDKKLLKVRFDNDVEKRVEKYLKEAEELIMESVQEGKKETEMWVHEPNVNEFWEIYRKEYQKPGPVETRVKKELRNQGFILSTDISNHNGCRIVISWENFHPNTKYEQPDFEEELRKLNDKISRLTVLNEEADRIIAE